MSPYTASAYLVAIRFELGDIQFSNSRVGISLDEQAKLTEAIEHIKKAEENLKSFRFIKKIEDLPVSASKPVKSSKK